MAKVDLESFIPDRTSEIAKAKLSYSNDGLAEQKSLMEMYSVLADKLTKVVNQAENIETAMTSAYANIDKVLNGNGKIERENSHNATKTVYQQEIDKLKSSNVDGKNDSQIKALQKKMMDEELKYKKEVRDAELEADKEHRKILLDANLKDIYKEGKKEYAKASLEDARNKGLENAINALKSFTQALNGTINTIANYKQAWDTRLNGVAGKNHTSISDLVKNVVGVSPFIKQSAVMEKLNSAIEQGIAYNVEQRAYFDVLKEGIADTFDAFDSTLKDIIRVQQADSTAYRLGMEASLNEYLNAMFQNTEYLSNASDGVTSALYQATSLLNSTDAVSLEYQVQKWLGSLYSVGMSSEAISNIASALGQLASGDVSGTDSGAGRLLIMAAANAGLDYSKMLVDGLDDSEMNSLMSSMVDYLQTIANDNKVVQTQLASVYGLKTSDIQAAGNVKQYITEITKTNTNGLGASANSLSSMLDSYGSRTNMAYWLTNLQDNLNYTVAEGIASNPALYAVWTAASMLQDATGGINLPAVSVMGTGVDLETTVAQLMQVGVMSGSLLSGIGGLFSGLGQAFSGSPADYARFGGTDSVKIGSGYGITKTTEGSSLTSYQGTGGGAVLDSVNADASDNKANASAGADADEKDVNDLWDKTNEILELLRDIVEGNESFTVREILPTYSNI